MSQRNQGHDELARLMHAVSLLGRQQWERATWGGAEEAEDALEENRRIAAQVLPIIEQSLDEDLIAELDRGRSRPRGLARSSGWLLDAWLGWLDAVTPPSIANPLDFAPTSSRVRDPILSRVLNEFCADITKRFRRASNERRHLSPEELSTTLERLRSDLEFLVSRSQRSTERTTANTSQ